MKVLELLGYKKRKQTHFVLRTGFHDTYQESLNRVGREQFVTIVSRGVQMPGLAL